MGSRIYFGENLTALGQIDDGFIDLIYIKPPTELEGDIEIDQEELKRSFRIGSHIYTDLFDAYLLHLEPRIIEARRVLAPHGSIYFHTNPKRVHHCKVLLLDQIFGRENFLSEIIWALGHSSEDNGRAWPEKHDNILVYGRVIKETRFNIDNIDRIPYMAPGLVEEEKEESGKLPTDTWWYTQQMTRKKLMERITNASSNPGNLVLDLFAGEGTMGEVCLENDRQFFLIEEDRQNLEIMAKSFLDAKVEWINFDPTPFQRNYIVG